MSERARLCLAATAWGSWAKVGQTGFIRGRAAPAFITAWFGALQLSLLLSCCPCPKGTTGFCGGFVFCFYIGIVPHVCAVRWVGVTPNQPYIATCRASCFLSIHQSDALRLQVCAPVQHHTSQHTTNKYKYKHKHQCHRTVHNQQNHSSTTPSQ